MEGKSESFLEMSLNLSIPPSLFLSFFLPLGFAAMRVYFNNAARSCASEAKREISHGVETNTPLISGRHRIQPAIATAKNARRATKRFPSDVSNRDRDADDFERKKFEATRRRDAQSFRRAPHIRAEIR